MRRGGNGNAGVQVVNGGGSLRLGWWLQHWLRYMEAGRGAAEPGTSATPARQNGRVAAGRSGPGTP